MESNKEFTGADPDYEKYNLALKEIEEKENEEKVLTSEKVSKIIADEFDRELAIRQKHLEDIQDKIFKAQKLLHLVRYVLISSYYNKQNLEHASTSENLATSIFDAQNRIHPAIKKLLGNNRNLDILTTRGKRKIHMKNETNESTEDHQTKKVRLKETETNNLKLNNVESIQSSVKRKKTKHRILVGNISKWVASLENDNTTHKWMVYVRGPKEAPDVSHIIEKVMFYLHPSYKPHDIVEVSQYPFHLSRRGWGEFPLRVQIFFKCPLNKPVSIIHNLKLDKTYSGRQTLGNETIVDVYLHDAASVKSANEDLHESKELLFNDINVSEVPHSSVFNKISESDIKKEFIDVYEVDNFNQTDNMIIDVKNEFIKEEPCATTSLEHNYFHGKIEIKKEDIDFDLSALDKSLLDHSYSLPYNELSNSSQGATTINESRSNEIAEQNDNNLVFGLDKSYFNNTCNKQENLPKEKGVIRTFTTITGQPIKVLPQSFNKCLLSNGNVVQIKVLNTPPALDQKVKSDVQQSLNTKECKNVTDQYRVNFPRRLFKNMGEVLPYLFRRLPLWNELANNPSFKSVYPFVARSKEEFFSWNIGKRLNSEWCRAKAIKELLCFEQFPESEKWNTKTFFMYARSHGFSPVNSQGILFKRPSTEIESLMTCFSGLQQETPQHYLSNDINVNVVDNNVSPTKSRTATVDISDTSLRHHCSFVKETALDCGIVLKPEEISEGVTWNGAERMILEAVKCLADNLIRRARHHLVCQESYREGDNINVANVEFALNERSEIKRIIDYQKERLVNDFFS